MEIVKYNNLKFKFGFPSEIWSFIDILNDFTKKKTGFSCRGIFKKKCAYTTLHVIYIIKQDIRIYVTYSRPNGWTVWAEFFCGHSWVTGGVLG